MTRTCYDSINVNAIPADAQLAAGYAGGNWPTYANGSLRARCPHAILVSIAVNASEDAMVLDVERGDATPSDAPAWCQRQRARGQVPTVYCNASTWPAVQQMFHDAGQPLPQWWDANYDNNPTLPAGAVAKQYRSDTNQNLDYSVVADYWPGVDPARSDIMATDTDRGGLVRLTYLASKHREPTPQEWGIGKMVLAQHPNLDAFVESVADNGKP